MRYIPIDIDKQSAASIAIPSRNLKAIVALNGADETNDRLAICFAEYLHGYRLRGKSIKRCCTIASYKPKTPKGYVCIPHLVGFYGKAAEVEDKVVWELMDDKAAVSWLGHELPDQSWVEERLPQLLRLRKQYREGTLDKNVSTALEAYLNGRYLSILFVYQNLALLRPFLS